MRLVTLLLLNVQKYYELFEGKSFFFYSRKQNRRCNGEGYMTIHDLYNIISLRQRQIQRI